ncbi:hypothetical protein GCM10011390_32670 [Aureimonas endophytica]|uniref:SGNH/GDSL hydrolase family protein n=1 Tax=Aureimonas endophytica TaxID=2027858 RepID=A0A916ZTP9_9HYPH|nr:SGNH/GDSL hydrolase family protein [Aureimonas endophytica]GGE11080.1 hypothetical protein GCM10011390_32670 [Aureimonas endophytica]
MKRITLFAKGNVDVHDSLHSCRIGGAIRWNGLNEALRVLAPGTTARVIHETFSRSDALLAAGGALPAPLSAPDLPLGAHWREAQFSTALFETAADAIVLSIQPDIATRLMRHRAERYLLYPDRLADWPAAQRDWLRAEFEPAEAPAPEAFRDNLVAIVRRLRERHDRPILVYNVSSIVPGEAAHCFQGFADALSTRIKRFNLALIDVSEATGISIVDVDAIVARAGAERLKLDWIHLDPEAYGLVAAEVARILADHGLIDLAGGADAR